MVVASVLMSLGMMMLSPVLVALPFKLMLFVLADGWNLLLGFAGRQLRHLSPPDPHGSAQQVSQHAASKALHAPAHGLAPLLLVVLAGGPGR
jgi:hypothetical protein